MTEAVDPAVRGREDTHTARSRSRPSDLSTAARYTLRLQLRADPPVLRHAVLVHPRPVLAGILAALCATLVFLLMGSGYLVAQTLGCCYVVLTLGMAGEPWTRAAPERLTLTLTLIGGALAMLAYAAYAAYAAWETPRLRLRLADWLQADLGYAAAVIARCADTTPSADRQLRQALLAARSTRMAWQEPTLRAGNEPVRSGGLPRETEYEAQQALAEVARVALLLEARLPRTPQDADPAAAALAGALRDTAERAATALREQRVPDWRPIEEALGARTPDSATARTVQHAGQLLLAPLRRLSEALSPAPAAPPPR
ncbi:hypothetical protein [Streptomyces sp. TBY4]|uniref:hypothetical protein n=1 Tax=Streptomyces sp. TBY4 TaxID=2962030 RepID=UPI0020B875EC|nr:hypothetical protein [Streptomyces sp. TBY4]MCP3757983.1 hypothetical protein [Streptomyces sp. TBY4]